MGDVVDHERLVNVHLQVAAGATKAHSHIVGHYLDSNHRERLGLRRVHLAGHDRGAWLVGWDCQLGETGTRTARHQPNVIRDLIERDCKSAQCAGELHQSIVSALHRELVGSAAERKIRELRNFGGSRVAESGSCIDAGSYGCSAKRKAIYILQCILYTLEIVVKHPDVTRPFL